MNDRRSDQTGSNLRRLGYIVRCAFLPAVAVSLLCSAVLWVAFLWLNPSVREPSQAFLLFAYLFAFHVLLLFPFALLIALIVVSITGSNRFLPPARSATYCIAATVLTATVALNAILRFTLSYSAFRQEMAMLTPLGTLNLLVFLASPIVVLLIVWPRRSSRWHYARLLVAWTGVFLIVCTINVANEHSLAFPIDRLHISRQAEDTQIPKPASLRPDRVALLGFDGLSWYVIDAMLREDRLPNFNRLLQRAARANLRSYVPTTSPILWTSIATGRTPEDHRIFGFASFRLPGMRAPLERGPLWLTMNWWNGTNRVLSLFGSRGLVDRIPFFSTNRQTAALWDVAAHHGLTTGVTRWYSTWPVPNLGHGSYMVSHYDDRALSIVPDDQVSRVLAEVRVPPRPGAPEPLSTTAEHGLLAFH
jgi:hypothetical protein